MEEADDKESMCRRVGLQEGLQHMLGGAVVFVVLAKPFHAAGAVSVLAGGAAIWLVAYIGLRLTRTRFWFGGWDTPSFVFVWSYALVMALAFEMLVDRWA